MNLMAINALMNLAVNAINAARSVRDLAKTDNPDAVLPTDKELIMKFLTDSQLLDQEATELREWLKTLPTS